MAPFYICLKDGGIMAENENRNKPVSGQNMEGFKANIDKRFITAAAMSAALQTKLGVDDKAKSAATADKAAQDADGNDIPSTYAKKNEIPTVPDMSGYLKDSDLPVLTDTEIDASFAAADATVEELMNTHGVFVGTTAPDPTKYTLWIKPL